MASDDAGLARVEIEAKRVLTAVDIDGVGEDVFCALDMMGEEAGPSRFGQTVTSSEKGNEKHA